MTGMLVLFWIPWLLTLAPPSDDDAARGADHLRDQVRTLVQPLLEKKQSVGVVVGVIEAGHAAGLRLWPRGARRRQGA